jgi:hypothetical protein
VIAHKVFDGMAGEHVHCMHGVAKALIAPIDVPAMRNTCVI